MSKSCREYFGERLRALRSECGMSQESLSKDLDISKSALGYYENCGRTPDIEFLEKVAEYFKVSVDYLLGRSNTKTNDADIKAICDYIGLSDKAVDFLHNLVEKTKDKENHEAVFEGISSLFSSGEKSKDFIKNFIGYIYSAYRNDFFRHRFETSEAKEQGAIAIPVTALDSSALLEIDHFILSLKKEKATGYLYYYFYDNDETE